MSVDSGIMIKEVDNENNNSIITYGHHAESFKSTAYSTSTMISNIRQLQTDFQAQYQHDKQELTELNQRFRLLIDRVQLLESDKSKYMAQIITLQQLSGFSGINTQWNENYLHLQSDLISISDAQVDYQFEFELYQLQIAIYQKLIDVEQQWRTEPHLKLEAELKQTTDDLIRLRASYADSERELASLYASRDYTLKQYLKITEDRCLMKKQQKKWDLNIQTLKSQVACYKNLRSYSAQNFGSLSVESIDVTQFSSFNFDKYVKMIRRDFEQLYAAIYNEMTAYYETQMVEIQTEVERTYRYQQSQMEELVISQQTLQIEYEEVQASFSYQQQTLVQYEATYSKLETDLKSIEFQYDGQFEIQAKEIHSAQESIMMMMYGIEEMRRSVKYLQTEIIIYRHLLDSCGIQVQEQTVITSHSEQDTNVTTQKFVVESEGTRKGSIGIKECDTSGKYITLMNYSMHKDIDMSRWTLERRIDSSTKIQYTIPQGVRLQPNKELIIYSNLGANELQSDHRIVSSLLRQELVYDDLKSWGMGTQAETTLFNQNGEEKATLTQAIVFEKNSRL